ncbi:MAG: Coq4 family protein [bacterium]
MTSTLPELHPDFVQNMVRTFNNPDDHGVHLLFNEWWATAPQITIDRYVANFQAMPGAEEFLSSGYFAPQIELETLQQMPMGSLGRGYYEFLSDNGLEKNLATNYKQLHDYMASSGQLDRMPEPIRYAIIRGFQIHDILHVVTGYTPNGLHELALQAFCLAQLQFPYFGMWMATTTARMTFLQPDSIVPVMDAITQGWQYGRTTPNLQFERWEDLFEQPLSEIRERYSIPAATVVSLAA